MAKIKEVYKCEMCGNIIEVLHGGAGELVCCGKPMNLLEEKTKDAATEKHVPYVEKQKDGYLVKVGQNQDHPMTDEHSIEWIELHTDNKIYREYLKPGNSPQAFFPTGEKEKVIFAREYCNIHGLWKN